MAGLKKRFEAIAQGEKSLQFDPLAREEARLALISPSQIEADPDQPREEMGDLEELKASIQEHGIIQPCIVSVAGDDRYRLIAGERRWTAATQLGLKTIPCVIRTVDEHRRLEVQLIENIHRKDLSPLEEARAYQKLMVEFNLSQRQLAARLGKSVAGINQMLRLLTLPEDLMESVQTSEHLTRSVLLEIAKKESPELQRELLQKALTGSVTVRALRDRMTPMPSMNMPSMTMTPGRMADLLLSPQRTMVFEGMGTVKVRLLGPASDADILSFLKKVVEVLEREAQELERRDPSTGKRLKGG